MIHSCTDLWELGPPPDFILSIPPPPVPENIQISTTNVSVTPCGLMCDVTVVQGAELVELARHGRANDDHWFLFVLCCGFLMLLISTVLAFCLLKFKESRESKISLHEEHVNCAKSCETVLYPPAGHDKLLWATLTPKGTTQHFATMKPPLCVLKNSFENSAFIDSDDLIKRPKVSLPTKIDNPNIPPLNLYPSLRKNHLNQALLL